MSNLLLLLLFCIIYNSGTSTIPVRGRKGGDAILTCEYKAREISDIRFIRHRKRIHFAVIPVCPNEEHKRARARARVCKKEACDVVIKDLIFSDAGKYIFRFDYKNALTELEYQLYIYDEFSVKISEKLKLDVLLSNADKVQHQRRSSTEWKDVWKRGHGVQNDQLNDRDGNLIINNFTASDAGTYRVLGSEGELLIIVTVEESPGSPECPETPGPTNGPKSDAIQNNHWIGPARQPVCFWVVLWWLCLF
ncbi:uncharacterized protein LOC107703578 [Sinocyclocheilus anshuiensis]|uniref:uncharacterized protein LOC107703578 n=1 Tax=Sinocyclocheilus anshuiensis TaxID=1608454 RepID=UPI0007BA0E12|nr:PREDICTED: uncharacterized protein LOC107703578 [Sinocyclocheilus anshuiensis]